MTDKQKGVKEEIFNDVEPLIADTPIVTINDQEFKMRRMGVGDTFRLAKVISIGAAGMGAEIGNIELNPEVVAGLLLAGFPFAERQILELLASIIGVKYEDMKDPEKFPMGSEIEIISKLMEHVDMKAFFTKATGLFKKPAVKGFLKSISTSSKQDIKSQTKK